MRAEADALEKQIMSICSSDKDSLEAYIALALIHMEDMDEQDDFSQLKFEAALLSARALDPDFSQTKNILSAWLDENSISSRKIE
jgi:hypothetical protein